MQSQLILYSPTFSYCHFHGFFPLLIHHFVIRLDYFSQYDSSRYIYSKKYHCTYKTFLKGSTLYYQSLSVNVNQC